MISPTPKTDQEIIHDILRGDERAFTELLDRYERSVYNFIRRQVRSTQDAQDLAQETFIKVFRFLHSYRTEKKFITWVFTIATNTLHDWWRKERRAPLLFDEPGDVEEATETNNAESAYTTIEASVDLARALESIRPEYAQILLLYYRHGFSYEDIASALHLPLNTVKTHLARAKQALRKHLHGYDH